MRKHLDEKKKQNRTWSKINLNRDRKQRCNTQRCYLQLNRKTLNTYKEEIHEFTDDISKYMMEEYVNKNMYNRRKN